MNYPGRRSQLSYHEAGMDLELSSDPEESFKIFQGRIKEQYDSMAKTEGLTVIDATKGIEARHLVRGIDDGWLKKLFAFALKPDLVFYLSVPPEELMHRCFHSSGQLPYWESGMDLALSNDIFDSFLMCQERLKTYYEQLADQYEFDKVDGTQSINDIHHYIGDKVKKLLNE